MWSAAFHLTSVIMLQSVKSHLSAPEQSAAAPEDLSSPMSYEPSISPQMRNWHLKFTTWKTEPCSCLLFTQHPCAPSWLIKLQSPDFLCQQAWRQPGLLPFSSSPSLIWPEILSALLSERALEFDCKFSMLLGTVVQATMVFLWASVKCYKMEIRDMFVKRERDKQGEKGRKKRRKERKKKEKRERERTIGRGT